MYAGKQRMEFLVDLMVGFRAADYAEDLIGIMDELIARLAKLLEADAVKMFGSQLKRFLRQLFGLAKQFVEFIILFGAGRHVINLALEATGFCIPEYT